MFGSSPIGISPGLLHDFQGGKEDYKEHGKSSTVLDVILYTYHVFLGTPVDPLRGVKRGRAMARERQLSGGFGKSQRYRGCQLAAKSCSRLEVESESR